jgi:hypothetical protein
LQFPVAEFNPKSAEMYVILSDQLAKDNDKGMKLLEMMTKSCFDNAKEIYEIRKPK